VSKVRYSREAEDDLAEIALYTIEQWSLEQADRYLTEIEACCESLLRSPALGRRCDDFWPGFRRIERKRHVIFYMVDEEGIFVGRILHESRLPQRG
jgi:toxin ParE1/3/4